LSGRGRSEEILPHPDPLLKEREKYGKNGEVVH